MDTWTERTLGEISAENQGFIRTGPFGSQLHESDYSPNGTPVIMPKNIAGDKILIENIARVSNHHTRDLLLPKLISGELDASKFNITIPEEAENESN